MRASGALTSDFTVASITAAARPGEFNGRGVVGARSAGGPYHPTENRSAENRGGPRPESSSRNLQRAPMSRPEGYSNRGAQPMHNEARPVSRTRTDSGPRPSSSRGENGRQHESAPRSEERRVGKEGRAGWW